VAAKVKAAGMASYNTMVSASDYTEFQNFSKWLLLLKVSGYFVVKGPPMWTAPFA